MTQDTIQTFVKVGRARDNTGEGEHWTEGGGVHPTMNCFDAGDARCVCAVVHRKGTQGVEK